MKPYHNYKITDKDLLKFMMDQLKLNPDKIKRNMGNIHDQLTLGWPGKDGMNFWDDKMEVFQKLCDVTYPYGKPIINSWIKIYNEGEYSCLHQDDINTIPSKDKVNATWTNSILIDQSEEIVGGTIVVAGDGWEPNFEQIKSRLFTFDHKEIGDTAVWDNDVVHGVSNLEKGYRITLIVIKEKDKNSG